MYIFLLLKCKTNQFKVYEYFQPRYKKSIVAVYVCFTPPKDACIQLV